MPVSPNPLVSVIIPAYCHEQYIVECLRSIHGQTYRNIEIVLIDDCSHDETFSRAAALLNTSFGKRFTNVVAEQNARNAGAHATIARGISFSQGEVIAVINSDDKFRPQRLELLVHAMRENRSELAFSLVDILYDGDPKDFDKIPKQFLSYPLRTLFNLSRDPTIGFALMRENLATSTGNLMFTRSLYSKAGPFLPLRYCHDWDFVMQACFYTEPVSVPEVLYDYRLHQTNSFSALAQLAELETEVVLRRFFRRGRVGESPNPLFPCRRNWPGYFDAFVEQLGMTPLLDRESGLGKAGWRTYDVSTGSRRKDVIR